MQVTCSKGHESEIADPADDGWEITAKERYEPVEVTLPDGSKTQVIHPVAVPVTRRLVWKCAASAPTDNDPRALCGAVQVIEEVIPTADDPNGGDE